MQVLTHFGEQTNAWHLSLGFLITNKNNHYVSMFVLTTLESIIRRKWIGMPGNEKVYLIIKISFLKLFKISYQNRSHFLKVIPIYSALFSRII